MASALAPQSHRFNAKTEIATEIAIDHDDASIRSVEVAFCRGRQLGQGTYGKVYLATDNETHEEVALKKIKLEANKEKREGFPITAIREIRVLMALNHPNVINLKEIVRSNIHASNDFKGSIYLVFEYMQHDLAGLHERLGKAMPPALVKTFVLQTLQGLHYCHMRSVLHRDLKASNLLINDNGDLKLADFGLARPHCTQGVIDAAQVLTYQVCTLWYRPPELLLGCSQYGGEVDIWSTGCILYELLTGEPLFNGRDEANMLHMIFKMLGFPSATNWPQGMDLKLWPMVKVDPKYTTSTLRGHCGAKGIPPDAIDLLDRLLRLNPRERMTTGQAMDHAYFRGHPEPMSREEFKSRNFLPSHEFIVKGKDKRRQADSSEHVPDSSGPAPKRHTAHNSTAGGQAQQQPGLDAMLQAPGHAPHGGSMASHYAQQRSGYAPAANAGGGHMGHQYMGRDGDAGSYGGGRGEYPPLPQGTAAPSSRDGGARGQGDHDGLGNGQGMSGRDIGAQGLYGMPAGPDAYGDGHMGGEPAPSYGAQHMLPGLPSSEGRGRPAPQAGPLWGSNHDSGASDRNPGYGRR